MTLVNEFGHRESETDSLFFFFQVWEDSHHSSKTSLLLMELLPVLKENHFCNWSWRHHLVLTSICVKKRKEKLHTSISVCTEFVLLTVRSKSRSDGWLHLAASRPGRGIHGHATVICPRLCFCLRGFSLRQRWRLTVWTPLPLPGARMDQMQQSREEEGEEGGEAVLLWLGGRVWAHGVSWQW